MIPMRHPLVRAACLASVLGAFACNSHPFSAILVDNFEEREETHSQIEADPTPIDILFVVDNSGSMEEEQNNLAANFGQFIDLIVATPAQFRIAVISTDMIDPAQSGKFLAKAGNPKVLDRNTANLRTVFSENARLGTMGDGFEKGLDAIEAALSQPLLGNENAGFLRAEAVLGVVLLSDEEDCSHDPGAIPEFDGDECVRNIDRMRPISRYINFLKGLKGGDASRVFFAAITGPDLTPGTSLQSCSANGECTSGRCSDGKCCPPAPMLTECRTNDDCATVAGTTCYGRKCLPTSPQRAPNGYAPRTCSCFQAGTGLTEPCTRYIDVVRAFGNNGIYAPICTTDWSKSLRDIAGLAVDLVCKFPLATQSDGGTTLFKANPNVLPDEQRDIIVKVNGQEVAPAGWNYNCPEPTNAAFRGGSISFDSASCPALNSKIQFIYEPATSATRCGAGASGDGGTGGCGDGFRCGNCGYCERTTR